MGKAVALAKETGGAAVVGTDGDGDRLVFGDGNGILSAGMAAIPILRHAHPGGAHEKQAKVLHDPKVNPLALAEWAGLDVAPVLFRNGHSHIKEHMRSIDALAAVEESGHFYHRLRDGERTIYAENSLVTILLFLRSLKERSSLMDELWETQNRVFTTGEFNYQLENNQMRDAALEKALQCFSEEGAAVTSRTADGMDLMGFFVRGGITLNTGEPRTGWYQVYIRIATNEKAVIRSYVSADDPEVGLRKEKGLRDIFTSFGGRVID
jgi:phosphomannomutase